MRNRHTATVLLAVWLATLIAAAGCGGNISLPGKPTADAGGDVKGFVGKELRLDGSKSEATEGGGLSFRWSFVTFPTGVTGSGKTVTAAPAFQGGDGATPKFTPPLPGVYIVKLIVGEGTETSLPDFAAVSVVREGNRAPVVSAGPDQTVKPGTVVRLSGTVTDPDGDVYTVRWLQTQGTDTVTLSGADTVTATFTAPATPQTLEFTLRADDGQPGGVGEDTVTVTVSVANVPPTADAGADQEVIQGKPVYLDGSRSNDPEGARLTYAWTQKSGPKVQMQAATAAIANFVAPTVPVGSAEVALTFTLVVNDGEAASAPDDCVVTVKKFTTNNAPVANAGPDQTVGVGTLVSLSGALSWDADGDPLKYHWTAPAGTTLSDATAADPTFTAPGAPATLKFQLVVFDGKAYSAPDETVVTVVKDNPNHPPIANAGPDEEVAPGERVALNGTGSSDVDGDQITYAWTQTDGAGVVLTGYDTATPVFNAPPTEGDLKFSLTVSDGKALSQPDEVVVHVKGGNHPPVANAGPDQIVDVNSTVTLDGSGSSDPDGDQITYKWAQMSGTPVKLSDSAAQKPTFVAPSAEGDFVFRLVVSDAKNATSVPDDVTIRVKNIKKNRPPVASAGKPQTVKPGVKVYLNGVGSSDPDGDPLTFKWVQDGGQAVSDLTGADKAIASFTAPSTTGALSFSLTVNDGFADSDPNSVVVTVVPTAGDPPVADAGPSQRVNFSTPVTLDGKGSHDPGGAKLNYLWYQVGGDPVALQKADTVAAEFTSPPPPTQVVLGFALIVDNGAMYSAPSQTQVSVEDRRTNRPPAADAGPDQDVLHGRPGQLHGAGSDPDGDPIVVTWTQTAGPQVTLSSDTEFQPTFTAPEQVVDLEFELSVNDGLVEAKSHTVVHVTNTVPTADAGQDQTLTATGPTTAVNLLGSGADADNDPLTFEWKMGGTTIATTRAATVDLAKGAHALDFTVSDGIATATAGVTITINNAKPVAEAGPDQFVAYLNGPTPVTLDGSGSSDVDGDALTYTWMDGATELGTGKVITVSLDKGLHVVTLEVSDGTDTATDTVNVDVDVGPPAGAIVLHAVPASIVADGTAVSTITSEVILDAAGSQVKDGNRVTVGTDLGEIVAVDADGNPANGIQVVTAGGVITFQLRGKKTGTAHVTAQAVPPGTASGATTVTLTPGQAAGTVVLHAVPGALPADGTSVSTITSDRITDANGNTVLDGTLFTVAATTGTIITADADPGTGGIQVASSAGVISFQLRAPVSSGIATVTADVVGGAAHGQTTVNFSAGPACGTIALHASPASIAADGSSTTVVTSDQIKDCGGNVVPDGVEVTVSVGMGLITTTDVDTNVAGVQVMTSGGIITFTVRSGTVAGDCAVHAAAVAPGTATGDVTVPFAAGPAARLVFVTQPPAAVQAGQVFSAFTLRLEDQFGNILTADSTTQVTLNSTGSDVLHGTLTKTVAGGVVTFGDIWYGTAGTMRVHGQAGALGVDSNPVLVNPGPPSKLAFCLAPATPVKAGYTWAEFHVCVTDDYGNVPDGLPATPISIAVQETPPSLIGTTTQNTSNGVAAFTDIMYNKAKTVHLTANGGGYPQVVSGPIVVNGGDLAKIVYNPAPAASGSAGQPFTTFKAELRDVYDNVLTSDNTSVVALSRLAGTGTLTGTLNRTVAAGVATFDDVSSCTVEAGLRVRASNGGFNADSAAIAVSAGPMASLTVAGLANAANECTAQTMTVEAKDSCGNRATGYTGTVHFTTDSAGSTLPADYKFTSGSGMDNGFHTFAGGVTLKGVGGPFFVRAADASVTGQQSGLTVALGPATHFHVEGIGSPISAGTLASVTVTAQNVCENKDTNYTGTAVFSSTDTWPQTQLPPNHTFTLGEAGAFTATNGVRLTHAGTQSVTATAGSVTGSQTGISVTAGSLAKFEVKDVKDPFDGCTSSNVTVTAQDTYGNTVTSYTGTVTFDSSDSNRVLPPPTAFLAGWNGTHTFANGVVLRTLGDQSVTAADGAISGTQTGITVQVGGINNFLVEKVTGGGATAGTPFDIRVTARDACNNTITTYAGTVHFTSSDLQASLPLNYTYVPGDLGVHVHAVTLKTAGNQTITVNDTVTITATGTSPSIPVVADSANPRIAWVSSPAIQSPQTACGTAWAPAFSVKKVDPYGNDILGDSATQVTLSKNTGTGTFGGTLTVTMNNSVAAFSNVTYTKAEANVSVTATASTWPTINSNNVTVNPGTTAAQLAFQEASLPTPVNAGATWTAFHVLVQDACGNTVTSSAAPVTIEAVDPGTHVAVAPNFNGTLTQNASAGIATFNNDSYCGVRSVQVHATSGALTAAYSSTVVVQTGSASQLGFTVQPPASPGAGTTWASFTVTVQDACGNKVAGASNQITIDAVDPATHNPVAPALLGTLVKNAVAGDAAFGDISYCAVQSVQVRARAAGLTTAYSTTAAVGLGTLNHFHVEKAGGGNIANQNPATDFPIRITAVDSGNSTVNFNCPVTLTSNGCGGNLRGGGGSPSEPFSSSTLVSGVLDNYNVRFAGSCAGTSITATFSTATGTSNTFDVCSAGYTPVAKAKNKAGVEVGHFIPGDIIQLDGSASTGPSCAAPARYEWTVQSALPVGGRFINPSNGNYLSEPATIVNPVVVACDEATDADTNNCPQNATQTLTVRLRVCASNPCPASPYQDLSLTVHGNEQLDANNYIDIDVATGGNRAGEAYLVRSGSKSGYRWNIGTQALDTISLQVGGNVIDENLSRVLVDGQNYVWFSEGVNTGQSNFPNGDGEVAKWDPFNATALLQPKLCGPLQDGMTCTNDVAGTFSLAYYGPDNRIFIGTDDGYTDIALDGSFPGNLNCDGSGGIDGRKDEDHIHAIGFDNQNKRWLFNENAGALRVYSTANMYSCSNNGSYTQANRGYMTSTVTIEPGATDELWIGSSDTANVVKVMTNTSSVPGSNPSVTDYSAGGAFGKRANPYNSNAFKIVRDGDATSNDMWIGQTGAACRYVRAYSGMNPYFFCLGNGSTLFNGVGVYNPAYGQRIVYVATSSGLSRFKDY